MKSHYIFTVSFVTFFSLLACTSQTNETAESEENNVENLTFDERKERHITGSLSMDASEKYSTEIFKEKLNDDEFEDAIITVNRLDFAKKKALNLKNKKQIEEMGYIGDYNYFIFYDGKLDKFSVPVPVPSSPINKLKVKFENLSSEKFKDLTIEYRILNASFRNYYTIYGDVLQEIFQVKIFDHLNESNPEAYFLEYDKGSICDVKNIMVYEGKITNYPNKIADVYKFEPEIVKTNKLFKRWFFNPKIMKYMTEDPELMKN
jgi:hypothetical protein